MDERWRTVRREAATRSLFEFCVCFLLPCGELGLQLRSLPEDIQQRISQLIKHTRLIDNSTIECIARAGLCHTFSVQRVTEHITPENYSNAFASLGPGVTTLSVPTANWDQDGIENLARSAAAKSLTSINLAQTTITSESLKLFHAFPALITLDVSASAGINDECSAILRVNCPLLQDLCVSSNHLTSRFLIDMDDIEAGTPGFVNLTSLDISNTMIDARDLATLQLLHRTQRRLERLYFAPYWMKDPVPEKLNVTWSTLAYSALLQFQNLVCSPAPLTLRALPQGMEGGQVVSLFERLEEVWLHVNGLPLFAPALTLQGAPAIPIETDVLRAATRLRSLRLWAHQENAVEFSGVWQVLSEHPTLEELRIEFAFKRCHKYWFAQLSATPPPVPYFHALRRLEIRTQNSPIPTRLLLHIGLLPSLVKLAFESVCFALVPGDPPPQFCIEFILMRCLWLKRLSMVNCDFAGCPPEPVNLKLKSDTLRKLEVWIGSPDNWFVSEIECPKLKTCWIRGLDVQDAAIQGLTRCPSLRFLDFQSLNRTQLRLLSSRLMTGLVEIPLGDCEPNDYERLPTWAPSLQVVKLRGCSVPESALAMLPRLPRLTKLKIKHCDAPQLRTLEGLNCPLLRRLFLARLSTLRRIDTRCWEGLPRLRELTINHCESLGELEISGLPHLRTVKLWDVAVQSLRISGCTSLEELNLWIAESLTQLSVECSRLRTLVIQDAPLEQFAKLECPRLSLLRLLALPNFKPDSLQGLEQRCPNIQIEMGA